MIELTPHIEKGTAMSSRSTSAPPRTGWVGWIAYAAVMMIVLGSFNAIQGLTAIFSDEIYVTAANRVITFDVTTWGWVHLIIGLAVVTTGVFLLRGALWATLVGTVLVMLNLLTQMLLLPAYPFWSLLIITVDLLVLWALLAHGDEKI
jgi:hypothetical protein